MGLDLGLEAAGLHVAVAVECNPVAVATIRANRPGLPVIDRKIEDVTTTEILEAAGLKPGEAFAVAGGPSCQAFSTAGARSSLSDPRGTLFQHFARVVREAQPHFFVMENVRGLLSAAVKHRSLKERGPGYPTLEPDEELGSALKTVASTLRELGYYTIFDILNAADFGVPQARERLVFLGTRYHERIAMPAATHDRNGDNGLPKWQILRSALEGLEDPAPEFTKLCPSKAKYLAMVPEGGNWRALPEELQSEALGRAFVSWGGRSGFFRRLSFDRPSPALTTRPDSKATSLCHPTELRPLSIREYARIQQFPEDWTFAGSVRQKYEQVGNAVPVGLGKAIGQALIAAQAQEGTGRSYGRVECWNLDLLAKMLRRPRTIVNPPHMRNDTKGSTISDWHQEGSRMRADAFEYVPPERLNELKHLISVGGRKRLHPAADEIIDVKDELMLAAE
ncbi:DNA (cytosine-5)-methyltransferase 1 [Nitrospirillum iridis]|uniref:DNA (cytosine-5-)-methyltransferase n=2 Tax=Nitrospirillum iridis TaxID=765888 RepID=A0A7X0AWM9_9PROT|nr:DNA (cytosine-5)-methyltransferase 1 [Nitrospirillum iridis]